MEPPPSPLPLAHQLLSLIFSAAPVAVPPSLLSTPTRQAHHFLSSSPNDPQAYWQPITLRKEVEVERMDYVQSGSLDDLHPELVSYHISPPDIKALIPLGNSNLSLVLLYETHHIAARPPGPADAVSEDPAEDGKSAWGFLELTATASARHSLAGQWYTSMEDAVKAVAGLLVEDEDVPLPSPRRSHSALEAERSGTDSPTKGDGGAEASRRRNELVGLGVPTTGRPGMGKNEALSPADGEGTTPGAYGAADDFWAGWEDDPTEEGGKAHPYEPLKIKEDSEDDYWSRYGKGEEGEGLSTDRTRELSMIEEESTQYTDSVRGSFVSTQTKTDEPNLEASLPPLPGGRPESMASSIGDTASLRSASTETASKISFTSGTASPVSLNSPTSPPTKSRLFAPLPPAPSQLRSLSMPNLLEPSSPSTTPRQTPTRTFATPANIALPLSPPTTSHSTPIASTAGYFQSLVVPPDEPSSPTWPTTPTSVSNYSVMTEDAGDPRASRAYEPTLGVLREDTPVEGYKRKESSEEEQEDDERLKAALVGVWALWTKGKKAQDAAEVGGRTFAERWRQIADEIAIS